jgi:hypothetical protein
MSRLTSKSPSSAPTGSQNPFGCDRHLGDRPHSHQGDALLGRAPHRYSPDHQFSSLRRPRYPSASALVETVAANYTRNPSARPARFRFRREPMLPCRDCDPAAPASDYRGLICRVTRSRGNERELLGRPPRNSMSLVRTATGVVVAHAKMISPMSGGMSGLPPITKISPTPSSAASAAIRRTRSIRSGALGDERIATIIGTQAVIKIGLEPQPGANRPVLFDTFGASP